jgi:Dehydrogenases with different specificities (related to short-chain alcohol dehydrogenases)
MRLAIHYHNSEREALDVVREAGALSDGAEARAFPADLRDAAAAEQLVQDVAAHFGALDVLVNSAAVMLRTPLDEVSVQQWDDIFALNLRAPFFCARSAAAVMRRTRNKGELGGGVIINIADLAGLESWPAYVPHGVSKAGVIQMTRSLARVLAPDIRVNAIAPGAVLLPESWSSEDAAHLERTTPLRRLGTPDDVARAMIYLLEADYVTGETIVVDGGRHIR